MRIIQICGIIWTKERLKSDQKLREHLWQILRDVWNTILIDNINNLQLRIPNTIKAVQAEKGGQTEY